MGSVMGAIKYAPPIGFLGIGILSMQCIWFSLATRMIIWSVNLAYMRNCKALGRSCILTGRTESSCGKKIGCKGQGVAEMNKLSYLEKNSDSE